MRVVVENMSADKLSCERWEFTMHTFPHMCLVGHAKLSRESLRKKKWGGLRWDCYQHAMSNTMLRPESIPADVVERAQEAYLDMIRNGGLFIGAGMHADSQQKR